MSNFFAVILRRSRRISPERRDPSVANTTGDLRMTSENGSALIVVMAIMLFLATIFLPLVNWIQNEARWSVKRQKSVVAFHLADSGIDRGLWKLRSSTSTWQQALNGTTVTGYAFDTTYNDVSGGYYRIQFSAGPSANQVTITSEGKDILSKEVRAVQAVYQRNLPGALLGNQITLSDALEIHWGPVMAQNNIIITDSLTPQKYFPRKFSVQVVTSPVAGYPRDINGIAPPNTDNIEWWSNDPVPDPPILDFVALRASAAASSTLNVYGCPVTGAAWSHNATCSQVGGYHPHHLDDSVSIATTSNNVWYWDSDLTLTGTHPYSIGFTTGTIMIVRGNLTIGQNTTGELSYTGHVPTKAWMEYQKNDTASTHEYPADNGLNSSNSTYGFGTDTSWATQNVTTVTPAPPAASTDTVVGIHGFVYVGGDLSLQGRCNIHGALWVVGNVSKSPGVPTSYVFYDDTLNVPTLNVVAVRQSWQEVPPTQPTNW